MLVEIGAIGLAIAEPATADSLRGALGAAGDLIARAWTRIGPWGRLAAIAYGVVLVFWLWLFVYQTRVIYWTDPTRRDPAEVGVPRTAEWEIETPDGQTLVSWRAEPEFEEAPVVLYLHGNRRGLWRRARFFRFFVNAGWGLCALAHRGFNGSTGQPSEKNNVADAILAFDRLVEDGVDPARIIIYGESLGSGTAVQAAATRPAGGLILHAPYDSFARFVWRRTLFLLPRRLFRERYPSIELIDRIDAPVLWIHGDRDRVIPMHVGRRLYDAATAPKYAALVRGANHFGIYTEAVFNQHIRFFGEGVVAASRRAATRESET